MKIVKLMGGLGNQMFEYAFGVALQKIKNENVLYDLSWFEEIKSYNGPVAKRVYELDCFNLKLSVATAEQVINCKDEKHIRISYLPKFLRKLLKKEKYKILSNKVLEKDANIYEPELFDFEGDRYFDGYFQCEKYFMPYRDEILNEFSLKYPLNEKNKNMLEQIKNCDAVSLHIRRGDYVNLQQIHGLCTFDYYKSAIQYISENVQAPHFFLFSDDIPWVIENLKIDYPHTIVDINSAQEGFFDLELMKNCKHNIIANSSFSWWGAWLNNNPNKLIIAPLNWYANCKKTDIVPDKWIRF